MKTVDISQIGDAIWEEIEKWDKECNIKFSDSVLETTKEARNEIKKSTPKLDGKKSGKHYIDSYQIKPNQNKNDIQMERVLWNKKYQLSHLIEDGHLVYTRLGRKEDINARKIGPLTIKKRSAINGNTFTVFSDNKHTAKFNIWKHTKDYASEKLVESIKQKFK